MSNLNLYALALTAKKYGKNQIVITVTRPAYCMARDRAQATGRGVISARTLWTAEESWFDHAASATEIPGWMMEAILLQEVTNE